jgi:hypothetical protein
MATTKKTTKTTAKKTTVSKPVTNTAALQAKVVSLELQVGTLQENLTALTAILEQEFRTQMLQGPRQIATKIKNAGLLEDT